MESNTLEVIIIIKVLHNSTGFISVSTTYLYGYREYLSVYTMHTKNLDLYLTVVTCPSKKVFYCLKDQC